MAEECALLTLDNWTLTMRRVWQDGNFMHFMIKKTTPLQKLIEAYSARQSFRLEQIRFLYDGNRLHDELTPEELEMEEGDVIEATIFQDAGPTAKFYLENHVASSIPAPHAIVPVSTEISVTLHVDQGCPSSRRVPWIPKIPLDMFVNNAAADLDHHHLAPNTNIEYRGRIPPWTDRVLKNKFHVVLMDAADVPRVGGSLEYHCERNNGNYDGGDEHSWQRYTKQMPLEGSLKVDEDMRKIHFEPAKPLRPNQNYAIVLQHYATLGLGCYSDVVIPFSTLSAPKELPEKLQHKDGITSEKDVQLLMKDREIEELKQTHLQMLKHRDEEMERHDAIIRGVSAKETTLIQEIKRLRHELNGVEVLDVDMGVSEVVERDDTDLPAKRVRLEQAVTASVSQALQERLVEVKKEKANVLVGMSGTCHCWYVR